MLERIVNLIPAECPPDTEYAAWFLSPLQHAIESPLIGGLAAYFAYTLGSPAGVRLHNRIYSQKERCMM